MDRRGDHLAACPFTGLLQRRAKPVERAWAQVLREAGGRVLPQQMLRDMDLTLERPDDARRPDVVAYNLPVYGGLPICGDATVVSPLHADGQAHRGADSENGLRLRAARKRKEIVYPEIMHSSQAKFVLLGHEVGGRWAPESLRLVARLARARSSQAPHVLRKSAQAAWHHRWLSSISVAVQTAVAASLAEPAVL